MYTRNVPPDTAFSILLNRGHVTAPVNYSMRGQPFRSGFKTPTVPDKNSVNPRCCQGRSQKFVFFGGYKSFWGG